MKKRNLLPILMILLSTSCNLLDFFVEDNHVADESLPAGQSEFLDIAGTECIPDLNTYEEAIVIRVIDGDSIEVNLYGEDIEVRYIGINTPEYYSKDQERAVEATQANQELVSGKLVYLFRDTSETDKYGRLLRYVLTDEVFVNLELVSRGYAQVKEYPPDTACHKVFNKAGE